MSIVSTKPITAEQLLDMGDIGRCELIEGAIIHMAPSGFEHGDISGDIAFQLNGFVRLHKLGKVLTADAGFTIRRNPDTVRAPDVSFVRRERLPRRGHKGYFDGAPDLAVEVISPSDRKSEVIAKANEWLAAGAQSVWVVDPSKKSIDAYRAGGVVTHYRSTDLLADESVLPGFSLSVAEVFGDE